MTHYSFLATFSRKPLLSALLIAILALALRLPGLGSFMTADEANWMLRSAEFYHELFRNNNPGGTFLTTHPGTLTAWLAGAGIAVQEQRLGFDIDGNNLVHFRKYATFPIAFASAVLIGLITYLLATLTGRWPAATAGVLLAADPYITGMSQIVHLDVLLGLVMVSALLLFMLHVRTNNLKLLMAAGIAAGLAHSNKSLPALWLYPVTTVIAAWHFFPTTSITTTTISAWLQAAKYTAARILLLATVAAAVFFLLWPALWVKDDVTRSLTRDYSSVIVDEHINISDSEDAISPLSFYARTILGRTSPHVLVLTLGVALVATASLVRTRTMPVTGWLLLFALGYVVLITFVAKKGDRYALPALITLPIIAGLAASVSWRVLQSRVRLCATRRASLVCGSILALAVISVPLLQQPYGIAYNNPLFPVRPLSQQGWGEGLEQAAAWLNRDPLGATLRVASWYPSVLDTYFQGRVSGLGSRDDARMGYVVLYRNMGGRGPDEMATEVLAEYKDRTPLKTITIGSLPYAWIYSTGTLYKFPKHIGELVAQTEVGQTVPLTFNNWQRIDIGLATHSSRANTVDVILHIRENIESIEDLRTVTVNSRTIEDSNWHTFTFDPIPDSEGKTYFVSLESPVGKPGDAITVRFSELDVEPGEFVLRRRALAGGETNRSHIRSGDMAYRLPQVNRY